MTIETIVLGLLVIALIWTNLRFSGRIMILEYRLLLATEALALIQGGKNGDTVAKQAREEIKKKYWFLDKLVQDS